MCTRRSHHDESWLECSLLGDACWQLSCLTAWQMRDPVWLVVLVSAKKEKEKEKKKTADCKLGGCILLTGWEDAQKQESQPRHTKSLNPIVWPAEAAKVGCRNTKNDCLSKLKGDPIFPVTFLLDYIANKKDYFYPLCLIWYKVVLKLWTWLKPTLTNHSPLHLCSSRCLPLLPLTHPNIGSSLTMKPVFILLVGSSWTKEWHHGDFIYFYTQSNL